MKLLDLVPRFKTEPWCINFTVDESGDDVIKSIFPYDELDKDEQADAIAITTTFCWFNFAIGNINVENVIDWDDYHSSVGC